MDENTLERANKLQRLIGELRMIESSAEERFENWLGVPEEMYERWKQEALEWARAEIKKAQSEFDKL
jgi:hypothetical protein